MFRATGIALSGLRRADDGTLSLFEQAPSLNIIDQALDRLACRFGRNAVFLGSSFGALKHGGEAGSKGTKPKRQFRTIFLGEVR